MVLSCPTEIDEKITLPGNIAWWNLVVAVGITFVFWVSTQRPFTATLLFGVIIIGFWWMNKSGNPGWFIHGIHWARLGIKLSGFHPSYSVTYDIFD